MSEFEKATKAARKFYNELDDKPAAEQTREKNILDVIRMSVQLASLIHACEKELASRKAKD